MNHHALREQTSLKRLIFQSVWLLVFVFITVAEVKPRSAISPCKVGISAAPFGWWAWAPKSNIKVYILTADFDQTELAHLIAPIKNWNEASEATGTGVKFQYAGETSAPLYCSNCLTIMRGQVFDKTKRHAAELRAYSARRNKIITWGHIVVDSDVKTPRSLTTAIAHEFGHNFGLLDCYSCKRNSTVMNQFNVANDLEGPTGCDVMQIKAGYKEVTTRMKFPLMEIEVEEEDEEPVDDDTPIVVPKDHGYFLYHEISEAIELGLSINYSEHE